MVDEGSVAIAADAHAVCGSGRGRRLAIGKIGHGVGRQMLLLLKSGLEMGVQHGVCLESAVEVGVAVWRIYRGLEGSGRWRKTSWSHMRFGVWRQ